MLAEWKTVEIENIPKNIYPGLLIVPNSKIKTENSDSSVCHPPTL